MSVSSPTVAVSATRPEGLESSVQHVLCVIDTGDWREAGKVADAWLAAGTGSGERQLTSLAQAAAGIVAAVRGDAVAASMLLTRCECVAVHSGTASLLDVVQLGWGIEALTTARYDEAWAQLRQLSSWRPERSTQVRRTALGFLAEVALHRDSRAAADAISASLEQLASVGADREFHEATAYARAVARRGDPMGTTFDQAIRECPTHRTFDRARINLARGVCLRRERRVSASRAPLLEALVDFEALGAEVWADQARRELRATGARRVRHQHGDAATLTAQEQQIVQMAAAGLSNREIGQRLFLSHRTIGSHLYRAYPKLGVASRSQLRDVLGDTVDVLG